MDEIPQLAQGLGITDKQLARLQRKYRFEHGDEAEEKLLAWLTKWAAWAKKQDRDRFLHRNPGIGKADYTYTHFSAMRSGEVETGVELAVPAEYQNVLVMEAKARFAEHRQQNAKEQEAELDLKAVQAEIRELIKRAVKMGVPPSTVLAPIAREIKAQHRDLRKAA